MKKIYTKLSVLLLIGAFALLTGSAFAQDITIASGATVTIAPGATVTGGELDNQTGGTLSIESDATDTGSLIVTSVTTGDGAVNVQRYLPNTGAGKWHIVSSPVGGQQLVSFATTQGLRTNNTDYALAPYSEKVTDKTYGNWGPYVQSGNINDFAASTGYIVGKADLAGIVTFTGTSIYAGNKTISIVKASNGWNAVGNPYTSAIWAKDNGSNNFLNANTAVIDAAYQTLYLWDATGTDYTAINSTEGQNRIAVAQGFLVKSIVGGGTVNFTAAMQVHATAAEAPFKSAEIAALSVQLTVTSGDLVNTTFISFDRESTKGLDPGYDLGKLKGNPNIALFTQLVDGSSDVDFMYQSVEDKNYELLTIPVGLDLKNAGDITFSLETSTGFPSDLKVYLEDKALNVTTQLNSKGTIYSASVPSIKGYGRFNLHFTNSTTAIDDELGVQPEFNVFTRDRLIFVNGPTDKNTRFSVYGIDGKMWYQNRAEATNRNTIDASGFAAGVYLIKIDKSSSSQTVKVVITE